MPEKQSNGINLLNISKSNGKETIKLQPVISE